MKNKMEELKRAILDHAESELRKEVNKRMVEERNALNKKRELEIAAKRRAEAEEAGVPTDEQEM